jgi:integrase
MSRLHLNAKVVDGLKPGTKRLEFFDTQEPGFSIRITPKGVKSFSVYYYFGNRLRCYTIGRTDQWSLGDARDKARDIKRQAAKGEVDPATEKKAERQAETFQELADAYIERYAKKEKKSWPDDQRMIKKYLTPKWKNIRASELKRADVRPVLEAIADEYPVMANRVLACLRKIYNWGMSVDLVETNPCWKLAAPGGSEQSRDRVLSKDEVKILWKVFDQDQSTAGDVLKMRLITAQRGQEIRGMRWDEIDEADFWTIPEERSKNGKSHRLFLSEPAMQIIESRRKKNRKKPKRDRSEFVFSGKTPKVPVGETGCRTSVLDIQPDIDDWTPRDLRRTAATMMAEIGIPESTISKLLNHTDPTAAKITQVYNRFKYDDEKKLALEKWAKHLTVLVSNLKGIDGGRPHKKGYEINSV